MSNWYFSDHLRQRHGPMPADALRAAFQRGELNAHSLVWTDGFPSWVPLGSVAAALGLHALPPSVAGPGQVMLAPSKKGMSGCMIALIFCALASIPLIAILAAIMLPAYQDYTTRAKVAGVVSEMGNLKIAVAEFVETTARCPTTDELAFPDSADAARNIVASRELDVLEDGRCSIRYQLSGPQFSGGRELSLAREKDGTFVYTGDINSRYLPMSLR